MLPIALLIVVLSLAVWLALLERRARRRASELNARCTAAFHSSFVGLVPAPELAIEYRYGFPAFTVTFASEALRDQAASSGLNASFLQAIDGICASTGSRSRPFDSSVATFFTWVGDRGELLTRHGLE